MGKHKVPRPSCNAPPSGLENLRTCSLLDEGHILCFKLVESDLLSVKVFGRSGHRLGCCMESSNDDERSSSSDRDGEDSDIGNEGSGREDDGSD